MMIDPTTFRWRNVLTRTDDGESVSVTLTCGHVLRGPAYNRVERAMCASCPPESAQPYAVEETGRRMDAEARKPSPDRAGRATRRIGAITKRLLDRGLEPMVRDVANAYGVPFEDLLVRDAGWAASRARRAAWLALQARFCFSTTELGSLWGVDASTVQAALRAPE